MSFRKLNRGARRLSLLAVAVAALVVGAGASAQKAPDNPRPYDPSALPTSDGLSEPSVQASAGVADSVGDSVRVPGLYIVQLKEAPVASYKGGVAGNAPIPTIVSRGNRPNMRSPEALRYADYLRGTQQQFLGSFDATMRIPSVPLESYQFAFNGMVLKLSTDQLAAVRQHPEVRTIEPVTAHPLHTDVGPAFIGAPAIWNGTSTGAAPGTAGEGIVVGVLDSGVNWESPSYADVGGDGHDHTNPLGAGNFLGVCATEPVNADIGPNCNDKLIGAYAVGFDFTQQVNFECANPGDPGNELGLDPATCAALGVPLRDYDNALDENGHGSHTASTAAGNEVAITYQGNALTVQGVAKHANLVVYDVCFTRTTGANAGQGSCFNFSTLGAVEQVVADGIVDVINFSIGGGNQPWTEAGSQAFLAAVDAGVFVSASAGNSGPAAGTVSHREPWVATVAASTHTRGPFNVRYTANGTTVPSTPAVSNQPLFLGTAGGPHNTAIVNQPLVISPQIDTTADGCAAYPPNTFTGSVAVIRRGTCSFAIKVGNAQTAGATAVIIANNQAGNIAPAGTASVPFPVFGATLVQSNALRDYVNISNLGVATVSIPVAAISDAVPGDVMAGFSSRGPSPFEALKPDITGPGVNILAAYVVDPTTPSGASGPGGYDIISGTSMSSPHNAGAAALVRAVHPTWTVAEVKSALMLTSNRSGITKEDGLTTADPFDRGAGRMNLNVAAESGLVMNETPLRFFQADPATGGDPSTLNVASLKDSNCVGTCSWTRRVRSVASTPVTYVSSFVTTSGVAVTVSPAQFTINPGQSVTLTITADISGGTLNQFNFGDLVLTPQGPSYVETTTPAVPVPIPDNGYVGGFNVPTQACVNIDTTGDVSGPISDAEVRVTMAHTWVGDVTLKLRSPAGSVLGLMSLPGVNELADNGAGSSSESANFVTAAPVTFRDGAPTSAEAMGLDLPTDAGNVCLTPPSACVYAPAPGAVAQPPSNFAGLAGGTSEGVWTLCAGDSVGADTGSITAVTLTVRTAAQVPAVHLPVVVFAVDPVPEITITPTSITAQGQVNGPVVSTSIAIGNAGPVPLNWNENNVPGSATVWEQLEESTGGIVSDFFQGDNTGAYTANDFTVNVETALTEIFTPGFDNTLSLAAQPSITWAIYSNVGGLPSSDPEVNPAPALWEYTANIGDPEVDITGDNITLDLALAGETVVLPTGTYWLTVFPTYTNALAAGNRWNWSQGVPAGLDTVLISASLFGGTNGWETLGTLGVTWPDTAFRVDGIQSCGAPWLSIAPTNGTVAAAGSQNVAVNLDPTGLAAGTYDATLCIASNDPVQPISTVPVTFTVNAAPTDPTATGTATPAMAGVGETTLLEVTVTPGANPVSSGITVAADLTSIGGSATQALLDDGLNGDATAGDNVFSFQATVGVGTSLGVKSFAVSVADAQSRTAATTIAFEVIAGTAPSGVGLATPANVQSGGTSLLTVAVTGGTSPPSTGLTVVVDLSAVGGSATQQMFDDGTNGDVTGGDGTFSYSATITGAAGPYSLPATIADAQSRSSTANIAVTIDAPLGDAIFADGFESP